MFKVIVLTHGGVGFSVLERLAREPNLEIGGIFIERPNRKRSLWNKVKRILRHDGPAALLKAPFSRLQRVIARTAEIDGSLTAPSGIGVEAFCGRMGIPLYVVEDYHSPQTLETVNKIGADLGVVAGTGILKPSLFTVPRLGMINLHEGKLPDYRGSAPGFWELFHGEKEVGVTIHYVNAKVDEGDIILQRTVPIRYDPSLDPEAYLSILKQNLDAEGVEMVADAVTQIRDGIAPRVPQPKGIGRTFKLPTWKEKRELVRRLRERESRK